MFGQEPLKITHVNQIGFDTDYEEHTIKSLRSDDEVWSITKSDGWSLFVKKEELDYKPKVGDVIRTYGSGSVIRGVAIAGHVARYATEEEHKAKWDYDMAVSRRDDMVRNWIKKDENMLKVAGLPAYLRERMEALFEKTPGFELTSDFQYELFIYTEAAKIADAFESEDEIEEWNKLSWEEQKKRLPTIGEGHSSNTFAWAVKLAQELHKQKSLTTVT